MKLRAIRRRLSATPRPRWGVHWFFREPHKSGHSARPLWPVGVSGALMRYCVAVYRIDILDLFRL